MKSVAQSSLPAALQPAPLSVFTTPPGNRASIGYWLIGYFPPPPSQFSLAPPLRWLCGPVQWQIAGRHQENINPGVTGE